MQRQRPTEEKRSNQGASTEPTSPSELPMETQEQHAGAGASKLARSRRIRSATSLEVFEHDLSNSAFNHLIDQKNISIDTETGGLDFREEPLLLVQICTVKREVFMIRRPSWQSTHLQDLLTSLPGPTKTFHHMLFDYRFLKKGLGIDLGGKVDCTKTMMKVFHPELKAGLASSYRNILGLIVSDSKAKSNWNAHTLDLEQLQYAAEDVMDLRLLAAKLYTLANIRDQTIYNRAIFTIRSKASLEVEGFTDVLDYEQNEYELTLQQRTWWAQMRRTQGTGDQDERL